MIYYSRKLRIPFANAVEKITNLLRQQGFGIVTTIDLQNVLKSKLGIDFRNYTILGACNPEFAYKAVTIESHIGLMLPCNVVIQQHENGEVEVSAINPLTQIEKVNTTDQLITIANEVSTRLRLAIDDMHRDIPEPNHAVALPVEQAPMCQMPIQG